MLLFKNTVTEFIDRIIHEGKRCFTVCIGQVDKKGKLVGFRFESIGTRPEDLDLTWCIVPASYHNPPYLTYLSRGEQEQYETELQERIRVQK